MPRSTVHALRALLLPALGCLLLCSAATATPSGLLPADTDWGSPPAGDWPTRAPALLPYEGWCLYLGHGIYPQILIATDEYVALDDSENIHALRLHDGTESWTCKPEQPVGSAAAAVPPDGLLFYGSFSAGPMALRRLTDGQQQWGNPKAMLLATAGDQIWAGFGMSETLMKPWYSSAYQLLDLADGKERASFGLAGVQSQTSGDSGPGGSLVVKLGAGYTALEPDGSQRLLQGADPGRLAVISMFPGGFVSFGDEASPADLQEMAQAQGATVEEQEVDEASWESWHPAPATLSCYDLPGGGLRWSQTVASEDNSYIYPETETVEVQGGYVFLRLEDRIELLSLSTRQALIDATLAQRLWGKDLQLADGSLYWLDADPSSGKYTIRRLELKSSAESSAVLEGIDYCSDFRLAGNYLLFCTDSGGWNAAFADNHALYCLKLADGLPLAGSMQALSFPPRFEELQKRFAASSDPRSDPQLMQEIVGAGMNAVFRLTEACPLDETPQLDALAAAAEYLTRKQDPDRFSTAAANSFLQLLRERAGSELVPHVQRWMQDPTLGTLKPQLPGLLADCGTSEAAAQLALSTPPTGVRHRFPDPPYELKPHASYPTGFGPGRTDTAISSLKQPDGSSWAALYCDGLVSGTVIYLAQDRDSDGRFEQLWPTALRQCYDSEPRGDYDHPGTMAGLSLLSADKGTFRLSYLQVGWDPALDAQGHGWLGDFSQPAEATLHLGELEADTDGDGLSDIAEDLLYTDKSNPDTDGDGLRDADDGAPLSNPAWMGPAERGVARALDFFFSDPERGRGPEWWDNGTVNPWQARYISTHGAAPVDYVARDGTYAIYKCPEEDAAGKSVAPDMDPAHHVSYGDESVGITWLQGGLSLRERYEHYCRQVGRDPGAADAALILNWSSEYGGYAAEGDDKGALDALVDAVQAPEPFMGYDPRHSDAALSLNFHGVGYVVMMKLIDGEYYPQQISETWIS